MKLMNTQIIKNNKGLIKNIAIALYIVFALGFSLVSKAQPGIMPIFTNYKPVETAIYVGQVALSTDGDFYLVTADQQVFQLATNIDLTEYNGAVVQIEAHELANKIDPVLRVESNYPLQEDSARKMRHSVLVIFDIQVIQPAN